MHGLWYVWVYAVLDMTNLCASGCSAHSQRYFAIASHAGLTECHCSRHCLWHSIRDPWSFQQHSCSRPATPDCTGTPGVVHHGDDIGRDAVEHAVVTGESEWASQGVAEASRASMCLM